LIPVFPYSVASRALATAAGLLAARAIPASRALTSCSGTHGMSLRFDAQHQILPGFGECLSTLSLELACQFGGVNAAAGETLQRGLAVSAIDG
jgi:hypothetical protein